MGKCLHCTGFASKGATVEQAKHGTAICEPYSTETGKQVFTLAGAGHKCPKYCETTADVIALRVKWMGHA